jgi:hypothetical protein
MAWNQPSETKKQPKRNKFSISLLLKLIFLLLLIVVVLFLFFTYCSSENTGLIDVEKECEVDDKVEAIKTSASKKRASSSERKLQKYSQRNDLYSPTNKINLTKRVVPPKVLGNLFYKSVSGGRLLFKEPIFKYHSENILAGILTARPGERLLPVNFDAEFDKDFVRSMKEDIILGDDVTSDDGRVKEAVKKFKDMIHDASLRGERPSEIIMSMRDEMNRVADYRELLSEDFDKVKNEGSAQEIEDYLKEANELLKEFGADPLDLPDDEISIINERLEKETAVKTDSTAVEGERK